MKRIVIAALIGALSTPASAYFVTGNKLLGFGEASQLGFVAGVHDLSESMGLVCPPETATLGQILAVVRKYLVDNPANLHYPADVLTVMALNQAFPCKKADPAKANPSSSGRSM